MARDSRLGIARPERFEVRRLRHDIGEDHRTFRMSSEETPLIFNDLGLRHINEPRVGRSILSLPN